MQVVSTPVASGAVQVFASTVHEKRVLVAVVESKDGGENVDEAGAQSLVFLRAHQDARYPRGRTRFLNVASNESVSRFVRSTLYGTASQGFIDGDAVVFYAPSSKLCDRILAAIGAPRDNGRSNDAGRSHTAARSPRH